MTEEFTPRQLEQLNELINKPKQSLCRHHVLQDSACVLAWPHMGLHIDSTGAWLCPWCNRDCFMGHNNDCPAKDYV